VYGKRNSGLSEQRGECRRKIGEAGRVILYFFSPFHEHLSLGVFASLSCKLPHLQLLSQFLLTSLLHSLFLTVPPYALVFSLRRAFRTFSSSRDRTLVPFKPDTEV